MSSLNLDALILREDFQVIGDGDPVPSKTAMSIRELEPGEFFSAGLRKPDFQRETSEWDAKRVIGLVRTFVEDQFIPGVILWKNKDLIFVIDGSHRLSALLAWVMDDYGDGAKSREFFGASIPDDQLAMAQKARDDIEREVGTYADHKKAASNPDAFGPAMVSRARRLSTLTLDLQWVRGDATKAEESFIRINQQAANITPQELELIKDRRKPMAIAARAIRQKGKGHEYWRNFSPENQALIRQHATDIYDILFSPALSYPVKSADLPAGGSVTAGTSLRMIYDFIAVAVGIEALIDKTDDKDGNRTISYLMRTKRLAKLVISNDPASLGLHPAVYFYSWTGKQLPVMFLAIAQLVTYLDQNDALHRYTEIRGEFESFLISNRALLNQVIRKFGAGNSGRRNLYSFYMDVLVAIQKGGRGDAVVEALRSGRGYSYLQPEETSYEGVKPTRFSRQVKAGVVIQTLLESSPRCPICAGLVPNNAISIDHVVRTQDGGESVPGNAQVTHPYCNTGFKEKTAHLARVASTAG